MHLPRSLQRITRPLLQPIPIRIRGGPNRGLRWSLATAGRGYARGIFEASRIALLEALIEPGDTVWDVGAHKGYVTLLASRRVGPGGRVYAFEPASENPRFLRRHLSWNHATNVEVLATALGAERGQSRFGGSPSSLTGRLGPGMELVDVERGDSLVTEGRCRAPTFLKVDVEEGEAAVLDGVLAVVPAHARVLVATHSRALAEGCGAQLRAAAFQVFEARGIEGGRWADAWPGDPDLLAVGPGRPFGDDARARLRTLGF